MGYSFIICKESISFCELCLSLLLNVFSLLHYVTDFVISQSFETHSDENIRFFIHAAFIHTGST